MTASNPIACSPSFQRSTGKLVKPSVAAVATEIKQVGKLVRAMPELSGVIPLLTPGGVGCAASIVEVVPTFAQNMAAIIAASPSMLRQAGKTLVGNVATVPSLVKQFISGGQVTNLSLSAAVASVALFGNMLTGKNVTGSVACVATNVRQTLHNMNTSSGLVGVWGSTQTLKNLTAQVKGNPVVKASLTKLQAMSAAVASVASLVATKSTSGHLTNQAMSAAVASVASFSRVVTKMITLSPAVACVATVKRQTLKGLTLAVAVTPSLVKQVLKPLKPVVALVPSLQAKKGGLIFQTMTTQVASLGSSMMCFMLGARPHGHGKGFDVNPEVQDDELDVNPVSGCESGD